MAITAKEDLHVTRKELDEAVTGAEAAAVIRCLSHAAPMGVQPHAAGARLGGCCEGILRFLV